MTDPERHYPHSTYRGVAWHSTARKWRAYFGGRHLGLFDQEMTAAIVAYRERQRRARRRGWEDPEVVQQSELAGAIGTTRRWRWNRAEMVKQPRARATP